MEANFLFGRASGPGEPVRYREKAAESGCAVGGDGQNEASMGVVCGDLDGEREHLQQALELYRHKEIVHGARVVEARLAELDQPR